MKSYIITCNDARLTNCLQKNKCLNLDSIIILGPDSKTNKEVQRLSKPFIDNNLGCIVSFACMIAHLEAIKEFLKTNDELCIIYEDDVRFHKDFLNYIEKIEKYMLENKHVDVVSLGFVNIPVGNLVLFDNISIIENTYVGNPFGTQCYMIRRRHAKQLVDLFLTDNIYSVYQYRFVSDYTIFENNDKLKCNRTTLKFPIVIEDLSEVSMIGNYNKPDLLQVVSKNDFMF